MDRRSWQLADAPAPLLLTIEEAAQVLSLNPRHVARLARARAIPAVRIGRRYRIPRADLESWIAAGVEYDGDHHAQEERQRTGSRFQAQGRPLGSRPNGRVRRRRKATPAALLRVVED